MCKIEQELLEAARTQVHKIFGQALALPVVNRPAGRQLLSSLYRGLGKLDSVWLRNLTNPQHCLSPSRYPLPWLGFSATPYQRHVAWVHPKDGFQNPQCHKLGSSSMIDTKTTPNNAFLLCLSFRSCCTIISLFFCISSNLSKLLQLAIWAARPSLESCTCTRLISLRRRRKAAFCWILCTRVSVWCSMTSALASQYYRFKTITAAAEGRQNSTINLDGQNRPTSYAEKVKLRCYLFY